MIVLSLCVSRLLKPLKSKYEEIQGKTPKLQQIRYLLGAGIMQRYTTLSIRGVSIWMKLSRIGILINLNIYVYRSREILALILPTAKRLSVELLH